MKKSITHLFLLLLSLSLLVGCSKPEDKSKEKKIDPLEIIITPDIQKQIKTKRKQLFCCKHQEKIASPRCFQKLKTINMVLNNKDNNQQLSLKNKVVCTCKFNYVVMSLPPPKCFKCHGLI